MCKLKLEEVLTGTAASLSEALRDKLLDVSLEWLGLGTRIFTGLVDREWLEEPTLPVPPVGRDPLPPEAAKLFDDLRDGIKFDILVADTFREIDGDVLLEDEREPDLRILGPLCGKLGRSDEDELFCNKFRFTSCKLMCELGDGGSYAGATSSSPETVLFIA